MLPACSYPLIYMTLYELAMRQLLKDNPDLKDMFLESAPFLQGLGES